MPVDVGGDVRTLFKNDNGSINTYRTLSEAKLMHDVRSWQKLAGLEFVCRRHHDKCDSGALDHRFHNAERRLSSALLTLKGFDGVTRNLNPLANDLPLVIAAMAYEYLS